MCERKPTQEVLYSTVQYRSRIYRVVLQATRKRTKPKIKRTADVGPAVFFIGKKQEFFALPQGPQLPHGCNYYTTTQPTESSGLPNGVTKDARKPRPRCLSSEAHHHQAQRPRHDHLLARSLVANSTSPEMEARSQQCWVPIAFDHTKHTCRTYSGKAYRRAHATVTQSSDEQL